MGKKISGSLRVGEIRSWFMESGLGSGWIPFDHIYNHSVIANWFESRRDLRKVVELIRLEKSFHRDDDAMLANLEVGIEHARKLDEMLQELHQLATPELVEFERILLEFEHVFLRDRSDTPLSVIPQVIEADYTPRELLYFLKNIFNDYRTTPVEPEKLERISAALELYDVLYC